MRGFLFQGWAAMAVFTIAAQPLSSEHPNDAVSPFRSHDSLGYASVRLILIWWKGNATLSAFSGN